MLMGARGEQEGQLQPARCRRGLEALMRLQERQLQLEVWEEQLAQRQPAVCAAVGAAGVGGRQEGHMQMAPWLEQLLQLHAGLCAADVSVARLCLGLQTWHVQLEVCLGLAAQEVQVQPELC